MIIVTKDKVMVNFDFISEIKIVENRRKKRFKDETIKYQVCAVLGMGAYTTVNQFTQPVLNINTFDSKDDAENLIHKIIEAYKQEKRIFQVTEN